MSKYHIVAEGSTYLEKEIEDSNLEEAVKEFWRQYGYKYKSDASVKIQVTHKNK